MIDIVIPSMGKVPKMLSWSVDHALKSPVINKIIIIDNSSKNIISSMFDNKKVQVLPMPQNIYVNPAWNLGVESCTSENIIIMNDDIYAHDSIYPYIEELMTFDNIGLCSTKMVSGNIDEYLQYVSKFETRLVYNQTFAWKPHTKNITGSFFCIKKKLWKPIPNTIKLLNGDILVYKRLRTLGYRTLCIQNICIGHKNHSTMNIVRRQLAHIKKQDRKEFKKQRYQFYLN